MTVEHLLAGIAERGWRVNNLFQREDGKWQANVCRWNGDKQCLDFAIGVTCVDALKGVLGGEFEPHPAPPSGGVFEALRSGLATLDSTMRGVLNR